MSRWLFIPTDRITSLGTVVGSPTLRIFLWNELIVAPGYDTICTGMFLGASWMFFRLESPMRRMDLENVGSWPASRTWVMLPVDCADCWEGSSAGVMDCSTVWAGAVRVLVGEISSEVSSSWRRLNSMAWERVILSGSCSMPSSRSKSCRMRLSRESSEGIRLVWLGEMLW